MKKGIGILTFGVSKAGLIPLSNLISITCSISDNVYLISTNDGYQAFKNDKRIKVLGTFHKSHKNVIIRILNYILLQFYITLLCIKTMRNVKCWVIFLGGDTLVLPIIIQKISGKKIILILTSSTQQLHSYKRTSLYTAICLLASIVYHISDSIVLYSPNLLKAWELEKFEKKVNYAHEHFIDTDMFGIVKPIEKRDNKIGYIGRLSEEKGIINFINSMPILLEKRRDVEFFIIGDGNLYDSSSKFIEMNKLQDKAHLLGWQPHSDLPDILNEIKILVIPSYTEGLPNIMLEAIACGTLVLASSVGSIPDIINDSVNGFLLDSNSPDAIASHLLMILERNDMADIINNSRAIVDQYSFENTVNAYKDIF